MSEKVQYFNPFLVLIWVLQIILLAIDWSDDQKITWAIPVIGSFLLVQLYMVWKTNYDEMVEEQNQRVMEHYGDNLNKTPMITPGVTDLQAANAPHKDAQPSAMIQLNLAPSVKEDLSEEED